MRKGQVFILTAFIIALLLSQLGNIYTYSNLPLQTEQSKTSATIEILKNIQNEVSFTYSIMGTYPDAIADFRMFVSNFTEQRSYTTNFTG